MVLSAVFNHIQIFTRRNSAAVQNKNHALEILSFLEVRLNQFTKCDGTLSVTCGIAITWTVRKDDAVIHIKEIEQSCLTWSLAGIGKILPVDQRIDET